MTGKLHAGTTHTAEEVIRTAFLCFLLSLLLVSAVVNYNSLLNIMSRDSETVYTADHLELSNWIAVDGENTFCSAEDPVILLRNHNGYVRSLALNIIELETAEDIHPKAFWTNGEQSSFSEECSRELRVRKTRTGYVADVNLHVTDLRLDLYDNAGAQICIDNITINPRMLVCPTEAIIPLLVISVLLSVCIFVQRNIGMPCVSGSKKVLELDFVRAVCALGIILHHVSCNTVQGAPRFLYTYANGYYGTLFVGIFFMISGGVLYYNYSEPKDLPGFYYKRWKSIFPMFYTAYLFFFVVNAVTANAVFYKAEPQRIILSVLGMDGYLNDLYPGYYIIGEWFLGAIILLYAVYPIYAKLINKLDWKMLIILFPLTLWQLRISRSGVEATKNFIYCSTLFLMGMLIFKHRLYQNKILKIVSCGISMIVLFIPIPGFGLFGAMIAFVFVFLALFLAGECLMRVPVLKHVFTGIGGLSFPMFLVQNKIIEFLVMHITINTYPELFKAMGIAACLSAAFAWCVRAVTKEVMRTNWFSGMEKAVLSLTNRGK